MARSHSRRCSAHPFGGTFDASLHIGQDRAKLRQGHRAWTENARRRAAHVDHGGLDSRRARPAIEHEIDDVAKLLDDMCCVRRRNLLMSIRAGGGDRSAEGLYDGKGHRVCRGSHRNRIPPSRNGGWNVTRAIHHQRQRAGPESARETRRHLGPGSRKAPSTAFGFHVGDEWMTRRTTLRGKNTPDGSLVERVGAQAVNRLRRESDETSSAQDTGGLGHDGSLRSQRIDSQHSTHLHRPLARSLCACHARAPWGLREPMGRAFGACARTQSLVVRRAALSPLWRLTTDLLPRAWLVMLIGTPGCTTPRKPAVAPTVAASPAPTAVQLSASAEPLTAAPNGALIPNEGPVPALGPISSKATPKTDATWVACYEKLKSKGVDPAREVATVASACQVATKMKLMGSTIAGKQNDSDPPQSYPLRAEAPHCYRVYALADAHIEDLHVAIEDSAGIVAAQSSGAGEPVAVSRDGAVCFKEGDAAAVVVSVGRGGGTYAFQIWGD